VNPKKKKVRSSFLIVSSIIVLVDFVLQSYFRKQGFGTANSGISFGIAQGLNFWLLVLPAMFFLSFVIFEILKGGRISVFLITLGFGAIGNVIPRIIFGDVWDYINYKPLSLWVNLSDFLITISVLSYILSPDGSTDTV